MDPELNDCLRGSRIRLRARCPFFSVLVSHVKTVQVPDDDPFVDTAAVSTDTLYINGAFWRFLTVAKRDYVMAHEILHLALGHSWRCGSRNHEKWNYACDYAINYMLTTFGFGPPPGGGLFDMAYANLSADVIYDILPDGNNCLCGGLIGSSDLLPVNNNEPKDEGGRKVWERAVALAKAAEEKYGNQKHLEALKCVEEQSVVDWRDVLNRSFVTVEDLDAYDRRLVNYDMYVEDFSSSDAAKPAVCAVCVDTSGSTHFVLGKFIGELRSIADMMSPNEFHVYYADADLIGPDSSLEEFNIRGGGGTSFVPFFNICEEKKYRSVVYLTDLEGEFPERVPDNLDVLWVVPPGRKAPAPFGNVVEIVN